MELHSLLKRQMQRLGVNSNTLPMEDAQWATFLARINTTYNEADQERYLLERSTEISSRELLELNEKLERANEIAKLGYWSYDHTQERIIWSKEIFQMLEYDSVFTPPTYKEILELIHEDEREQIAALVNEAIQNGTNYEVEIRIKNAHDKYHWYHMIGYPQPLESQPGFYITGTMMDIDRRKMAEQQILQLHQQLLESARRAGMSDIAVSILHNVGNTINSANVSLGLLQEYIQKPYFKKIFAAIDLLRENLPNSKNYLIEDPQGKLIPEFLIAATDLMKVDHQAFLAELENLNKNLMLIKDTLAMRKIIGNTSGVTEKILLSEEIESALQMSAHSLMQNNIKIKKNYAVFPSLILDKAKLLQILINLFNSAKESLVAAFKEEEKYLIVEILESEDRCNIIVKVINNGLGIKKEELADIFAFGFTNKTQDRSINLHATALYAKELGGSLAAESSGLNQGMAFILTLPLRKEDM